MQSNNALRTDSFSMVFIFSWMFFLICVFVTPAQLEYRTALDWLIIVSILLGTLMSIGLIFGIKNIYKKYIGYLLAILLLSYCLAWAKDLVHITHVDKDESIVEMVTWLLTIKFKIINYSMSQGRYFFAFSKFYREIMPIIQIGLFLWWKSTQAQKL